jgi:hypothetical protein
MFVRYLGGGIGHGGNTTNIETPTTPDDETDGIADDRPEGGLDNLEGVNDEVASESEEEGDEHTGYSSGDIENEQSDDEELDVET